MKVVSAQTFDVGRAYCTVMMVEQPLMVVLCDLIPNAMTLYFDDTKLGHHVGTIPKGGRILIFDFLIVHWFKEVTESTTQRFVMIIWTNRLDNGLMKSSQHIDACGARSQCYQVSFVTQYSSINHGS